MAPSRKRTTSKVGKRSMIDDGRKDGLSAGMKVPRSERGRSERKLTSRFRYGPSCKDQR